jgi:hypothetical protein
LRAPLVAIARDRPEPTGAPDLTFTDRLQQSFSLLWEFLPSIVGAGLVLLAGYILAKLVQKGVSRALKRLGLNDLLRKAGVQGAVDSAAAHYNPARIIAHLAFWIVMFVAMVFAASLLGVESLTPVITELVGYVPSVIAAIVIIILGIVLGDFVGGLIMASTHSLHGGPTLARAGKAGVVVLAVFMSLQELGVATNIVTTAFAILFGAVALAAALSFGLGNRELAGEITRTWYNRYRAERDALAKEEATEEADQG